MYTFLTFALLIVAATGQKTGGRTDMDVKEIAKDQVLMDGLDEGVEILNAQHGRKNEFRLVRESILSGTVQIVAGWKYRINVLMVESECKNTDEHT